MPYAKHLGTSSEMELVCMDRLTGIYQIAPLEILIPGVNIYKGALTRPGTSFSRKLIWIFYASMQESHVKDAECCA